jgi:hypothetical protein
VATPKERAKFIADTNKKPTQMPSSAKNRHVAILLVKANWFTKVYKYDVKTTARYFYFSARE